MWLFDLFVPQFGKSDMSRYEVTQSISESPLNFEITRVDCIGAGVPHSTTLHTCPPNTQMIRIYTVHLKMLWSFGYPLVFPLMITYNRSSVTFASCDWWAEFFFILLYSTNRKILVLETFYIKKKWNSKLSIWVILDLWSIKVKKKMIKLNKSTQKYYFSYFCIKT